MVEHYIFESFLGSRSKSHQGHLKVKVISRSRSCEGQGHLKVKVISRSRSFQGQGHFKIKVISRSRSSQGQGHLKVMVISRSGSFQGQGHEKVKVQECSPLRLHCCYMVEHYIFESFLGSRSRSHQGHLKVKVISRSRSCEGQRSFVPQAWTRGI